MASHFWSIGEAQHSKATGSQSDAVGYAAGLVTWALAAGVLIAGKGAADQMPPWSFCFWRVFLAALVLVPVVRGSFTDIRQFVRHRGLEALVIGGLGLGITQGLLFTALDFTSAVNTGIIFSTSPMITLVLAAIVLREALGPWQAVGSLVAFVGIVVITVKGNPALLTGLDFGIGDLLAIVAVCTLACYTVLLKRAKFQLDRLPLLVVLMAGGAIASFPSMNSSPSVTPVVRRTSTHQDVCALVNDDQRAIFGSTDRRMNVPADSGRRDAGRGWCPV